MNRRFQKKVGGLLHPAAPGGEGGLPGPAPQPTPVPGSVRGGAGPVYPKADLDALPGGAGAGALGTDLWITAALLPFLVPLAVSEGAKSTLYGMEELETASRFSRKSVRWPG